MNLSIAATALMIMMIQTVIKILEKKEEVQGSGMDHQDIPS